MALVATPTAMPFNQPFTGLTQLIGVRMCTCKGQSRSIHQAGLAQRACRSRLPKAVQRSLVGLLPMLSRHVKQLHSTDVPLSECSSSSATPRQAPLAVEFKPQPAGLELGLEQTGGAASRAGKAEVNRSANVNGVTGTGLMRRVPRCVMVAVTRATRVPHQPVTLAPGRPVEGQDLCRDRGENACPVEVENRPCSLARVGEAAVLSVPDVHRRASTQRFLETNRVLNNDRQRCGLPLGRGRAPTSDMTRLETFESTM